MIGQNSSRGQDFISTGNETFDRFLGGGYLNSTLNIIERGGPSSRLLGSILNKSLAASTLSSSRGLVFVNFNVLCEPSAEQIVAGLPVVRKVKTEMLYKDVRGKSAATQIKIAWRYASKNLSPSDTILRTGQVDFGLCFTKERPDIDPIQSKHLRIINVEEPYTIDGFFNKLDKAVGELQKENPMVNIIISHLVHPFSPLYDNEQFFLDFIYAIRCYSRTIDKGAIQIVYDTTMLHRHSQMKQLLYNLADCVVAFYSYETDENKLTGYKNIDGTIEYVKVPKINSFGPHFQREISDWGYRLTKNHRFFVVDELSLPPYHDDEHEEDRKPRTTGIAKINNDPQPLKQVGPLEDFKEVAADVLARQL